MPIHKQTPLIAGIDPDLDKSGLSIWSRSEKRFILLKSVTFAQLLETIRSMDPTQIRFRIGAGWLNKGFHHRMGFPKGFEKWSEKSKLAYMAEAGSRVGENFGVGKIITHYLRANGYEVEECREQSGKWDAATFMKFTGLPKGYNPEIRDSARLVIGL